MNFSRIGWLNIFLLLQEDKAPFKKRAKISHKSTHVRIVHWVLIPLNCFMSTCLIYIMGWQKKRRMVTNTIASFVTWISSSLRNYSSISPKNTFIAKNAMICWLMKMLYIHNHNLKEHGGLRKDSITNESAVKKEPAESLTIKEEPIDCNDCGICEWNRIKLKYFQRLFKNALENNVK